PAAPPKQPPSPTATPASTSARGDLLDDLMIVMLHNESDSGFLAQILVARHIAAEHADAVPPATQGRVPPVRPLRRHGDTGLWSEHRARGLFLPWRPSPGPPAAADRPS
ncbi:hypothetical protein AB0N50_38980, partial [Streptomyces pharetrae]